MIGAQHLERGATLYVDFWDNKQPGIYLFYWLAGKSFGFHEVGVHTLELIWFSLLGLLLALGLRNYFSRPWMAALVPSAVIGTYYGMVEQWHLTQVEGLVGLPLFACLWLSTCPEDRRLRVFRWFLSGACASIVVLFKLALAPVVIAGWGAVIALDLWVGGWSRMSGLLRCGVAAFLGGAAVLAVIAAGFAAHGSLQELLWTTFTYPREALVCAIAAPWSRLAGTAAWFLLRAAPLVIFSGFALLHWRGATRESLTVPLLAWLASAVVVILIQRWSWWQYHSLLFLVPFGILAVRGLDALTQEDRDPVHLRMKTAASAIALLLVLLAPALQLWSHKARQFATARAGGWGLDYRMQIDSAYRTAQNSSRFLQDEPLSGNIYVFGNPLYLWLSQRTQAIPESGWSWEFMLPFQWEVLPFELMAAKPGWIFIDSSCAELIKVKSPATKAAIESAYLPERSAADGTWWHLKSSVAHASGAASAAPDVGVDAR